MTVRGDDAQKSICIEGFMEDVGDPQAAGDASGVICSADENKWDGANSRHQQLLSTQFSPVHHGHVEINDQ
jgi:hypothetical protein